jgi:D-ribose pyranase
MKKIGTLNSHLSGIIASMGHGDQLVICDSGLPIPRDNGTGVVDLALAPNIPRFLETVRVVLEELEVEDAIVASEMGNESPDVLVELERLLKPVTIRQVPHARLKEMAEDDTRTAFVRTGEATPFANVILVSGVTFGNVAQTTE